MVPKQEVCAVPTSEPFLLNPHWKVGRPVEPRATEEVRRFHRTLPEYKVTPLISLPTVADALGLGTVLVKDESLRLGLPAFKMLGASWAVHRALGSSDRDRHRLVTATDGNHGRAVARMAALLDLPATIVVPRGVSVRAVGLIRDEGAEVRVLDAPYDDAVRQAAQLAEADPNALLVQDTSWPGYEDVPQWIVDGYATLFDEAADQAAELGAAIDLVAVPAGVGSLAHAAVLFGRSRPDCRIVAVEPDVADCLRASLAAGALTTVPTGQTSMAGLNCGTPSYLAWPDLERGLAGAVVVDDGLAADAIAELAALGVDSGPCGAASLAALRILASKPARTQLGLGPNSSVVLLNTEGSDASG
jgi:diaminopropionate ammonia-lyase